MSPILTGVIASGISGNLTPPWSPEGAYDSLATIIPTGNVTSITFNGIPTGYKHLQIRSSHINSASDNSNMRFNNDSSNNYAWHELYGSGTGTAQSGAATSATFMKVTYSDGGNPGVAIVDILDYASSSKNKVMRSFTGSDNNGSGYILLRSGLWMNTSAINTITIFDASGATLANSSFALYGVK